ncbi:hypothetical protein DFH06DRAFT_1343419 [Mycena polygramma]|nr:hypothetical protein DFH06DRAFT_1343419 [Mycena polygramma]
MHSIELAELSAAENSEGPANDYFLSYPYLLVWTDQVDVWRFTDASDLTHVAMLDVYVAKPYSVPAPIIDHVRGLLILPELFCSPPRLCIFTLRNGELARDIKLHGRIADVDIQYRQADGHALLLLVDQVDVTGTTSADDPSVSFLNLVSLPSHLEEREKRRDLPPLVLHPISFRQNGDIIATSTTKWLGKVDLLYWQAGPSDTDDRQFTRMLELLPSLDGCKRMLPACHLSLNDDTLVLCTLEAAGPTVTERRTSIRALDTSSLAVRWTATPIAGEVRAMRHIASLDILVLFSEHNVTNQDEDHKCSQIRTAVAVLDVRTGHQRAIHAVDSSVQGSFIVGSFSNLPLGCFMSSDEEDPVVGLTWMNGDVLTISLKEFLTDGFEREGDSERARTISLFPTEVIAASMGRKEIVVVAGMKKHPVVSEGGREEDVPEWEEEEGTVMLARW